MPATPRIVSPLLVLARALARVLASVLALLSPGAIAQDKLPPIEPGLRARFGFLDPLIKKLGKGTSLVQGVQWNAKGAAHALVNNPLRARLDLVRVEDDGLESEPISTDGNLRGLQTADVDGDGKMDIVMLNSRGRLQVKLRREGATVPEIEVGRGGVFDSLRCGDIDGDGKADAIVLTRDGLRSVTRITGKTEVTRAEPLFSPRLQSLHLLDVDGDGHLDVTVCAYAERNQVQVKLGRGDGRFGPWIVLDTPQLLTLFPGTGEDGARLAAVHVKPRRVVEYRLESGDDVTTPGMLLTALPKPTRGSRPFAHGDLDGDGDADLVVADPERARLTVLREAGGAFAVEHVPTLAGVQSLAMGDLDGDGKADLVLASLEEETLSWVPGSGPLDEFPKPLATLPKIDDKPAIPLAVTILEGAALALLRNKNNKGGLYRVTAQGEVTSLAEIAKLRRAPSRLLCADLDGRHGPDVAYVAPGTGLQVLFAKEDGSYAPPAETAGGGFTKSMEDGALSLTGSGADRALLVVRARYARRFRFTADGQIRILSQDNGPEGSPSMTMGTELQDGTRLFLDRRNNRLYRVPADAPEASIDLPAIAPTHLLAHGPDALVLGQQGCCACRSRGATGCIRCGATSHRPARPTTSAGSRPTWTATASASSRSWTPRSTASTSWSPRGGSSAEG